MAKDVLQGRKRRQESDDKLIKLQALPCHDYHSAGDVIVPNKNLFTEKSFRVGEKSGCESVCWMGMKLPVLVSPKFEYTSEAITRH